LASPWFSFGTDGKFTTATKPPSFPKPVVASAENTASDSPVAAATTVPTPSGATPAAAGPAQVPGTAAAVASLPRERIDVSTDVLKLSFDTEGGSLLRSEFLKFGDLKDSQKPFVLLDESKARVYVAQTGLIGGAFASAQNTHEVHG
jgi:YidC/Oxa1 family membrane protein insertase